MDPTVSVSKGVFIFKNGMSNAKKSKKNPRKNKNDYDSLLSNEIWYQAYKSMWNKIENYIEALNNKMYEKVLTNLVIYVKSSHKENSDYFIPTAALLTGINLPDHGALFKTLTDQIKSNVTPHVAVLHSDDCPNIKSIVENMVSQFINNWDSNVESGEENTSTIKKSLCTLTTLESWYESEYPWLPIKSDSYSPRKKRKLKRHRRNLVIILPDFESIQPAVLQNFIQILNCYIKSLPFVLIFGVATSIETVHTTLPYQVSSKLNVQVFYSQQSLTYLNEIIDQIFLSEKSEFCLSSKVFMLLTDSFLFYDFSVKGFIQGMKFAMLQHYLNNNPMALCCKKYNTNDVLNKFTNDDLENVRRLYSFRNYVENQSNQNKILLLTDNTYLKIALSRELNCFHNYLALFHLALKCFHIFIRDLPKHPLGKQLRELYCTAISNPLNSLPEFNECIQLLKFLSKDELVAKLNSLICFLETDYPTMGTVNVSGVINELNSFRVKINEATFDVCEDNINQKFAHLSFSNKLTRTGLMEKLLTRSKNEKPLNDYEIARNNIVDYMAEMCMHLHPPNSLPFYEIFFYEDVANLKPHIIGAPRAAIHTALVNPQYYMQCDCCTLPNPTAITSSLPDISIVYKLHLECGKLINMYDWLQAFVTIVEPECDIDNKNAVHPNIQARFTRAVAELQFLGFINISKKKTDHVTRLTWGN